MRTLYRKVGFLALALIPYTIAAAFLHKRYIGGTFPWTEPIRTLTTVLRDEWMPVEIMIVLAIGASVWVTREDIAAFRAASQKQIDRTALRRWVSRLFLIAVPAFGFGMWKTHYNPFDFIALFAMSAVLAAWPWERATLIRGALNLAFVAVAFTAISYSFSVFKGLIFRFRTPKDAEIVAVEHAILRFYPHEHIASWASRNMWAVFVSDRVYFSLFKHFTLSSVFLMGTRDQQRRNELISALIIAYVLGGLTHYIWPGVGPTYFFPELYGYLKDGPIGTRLIRFLLVRNTEGVVSGTAQRIHPYGYVAAMPSLHIAHELVMLWYARSSKIALTLSIVFTLMTFAATLILGWHYPIDAVAGALLAVLSIAVVHWNRKHLFPEGLQAQ